mmetsp:Transcript_36211/g.71291  ORF Transcript_36211/g.71291 Transcript_36211/m.71291 type:complete len:91 (-) Transcript_36211:67-339(-)
MGTSSQCFTATIPPIWRNLGSAGVFNGSSRHGKNHVEGFYRFSTDWCRSDRAAPISAGKNHQNGNTDIPDELGTTSIPSSVELEAPHTES